VSATTEVSNRSAATRATVEVPIHGMDCAGCARSVEDAIDAIPGVGSVRVLLAAEKAIVVLDPAVVDRDRVRQAIEQAGYTVPALTAAAGETDPGATAMTTDPAGVARRIMLIFGLVVAVVLLVVVVGEGLGLLDRVTDRVPFPVGVLIVLAFGFPVFCNVIRAALRRQVISHTLMTVGVIAALVVGQWATAAIVVFFMRIGDLAESFTTERSRDAVRDLLALAPRTARVERDETEQVVPVATVVVGETVVVRPGEAIPVDGEVIDGQASVNQASITGESIPVDAHAGVRVFAASHAERGSLRIRATAVGADSTFGRVITLVENAEASRADVQRMADRFATWFLPVVGTIAALTWLISRDALATAAVLVVACSCSLALATPVAMLATVGAGAKRGLIIKGGRAVELLARTDVLFVDKTGTLTVGRPAVTDVIPLGDMDEQDVLALAASAERDSEHPLAGAVRDAAAIRGLSSGPVRDFVAIPGLGIRATVDEVRVTVGNRRLIPAAEGCAAAVRLEEAGKTTLFIARNDELVGVIAAADTLRPGVADALRAVRAAGIDRIEILTGDDPRVAAALATQLGVDYQAGLLPEDKIAVVREAQAAGHRVVMVGDGVNDAPALAQADVGIAMGIGGSAIASEASRIVLMREDWALVPDAIHTSRRTMGVVRMNLGFTAVYNVAGLSLAAFGILPPVLAAAAQSLPDIGILANSTRLLRSREESRSAGQTEPGR
jgi:Cd2+/Zn2+-exporting ATPase/Cu+-exporting ATPase